MEHVLRQCLIALRLAERIGLDEEDAGGRLLHGAARQRRLPLRCPRAGEMVRRRHRAEGRQVRPRARQPARGGGSDADAGRRQPAAASLPRRARVRARRAPRSRRDDRPPRRASRGGWPSSWGCPMRCSTALARGVRAVGRARLAGRAEGRGHTDRVAVAQLAEFVEVAHRVGGVEAATQLARKRSGKQFDPDSPRCRAPRPTTILAGLDTIATWDAVIDAEPALAVVLSRRAVRRRAGGDRDFVDLKSPYTLGHARAVADLAAEAAGAGWASRTREVRDAAPRRSRARLRPSGRLELDLGQARAARRRRVGARAPPPAT